MNSSIRTTLLGIFTIFAGIGPAGVAQFDENPDTTPDWAIVMPLVMAGFGLIVARDNNKTSEQVGAGNVKPKK